MRLIRSNLPVQKSTLTALALSAVAACGITAFLAYDNASVAEEVFEQVPGAAAPARKPAPKPAPKKVEKADKPAAAPAPAPQAAAAPAPAPKLDFAAKLKENGAGTCAAQINTVAAQSMDSVNQFNTASHWSTSAADRRLVAVSLGQRYADGNKVPFAATSVVASPNVQGSCDAVAVQVIPSPLSCAKLREALSVKGRQIADLAGVPLMQDPNGQAMLIPTAAESCVLVGIKIAYAQ